MSELTTLHDAIACTLRERMPDVLMVEAFPELGDKVQVPALLFGLTDMTLGESRGDGKTMLVGRFQSCILIDATRPKASLQAAILAAQMAVVLDDQYWDLEFIMGPPEQVHAQPEAPTQDLEQFVMWSVQWIQNFELGELEWPWPDQPAGVLELNLGDEMPGVRVEAGL